MLYLGIDQHKRQLTVNLRGEDGSVILKRQVSTEGEKVRAFFVGLAEKAKPEGGFFAILEVCGMSLRQNAHDNIYLCVLCVLRFRWNCRDSENLGSGAQGLRT